MGTLPMSISRTVPEVPKSMVAVARGPVPSVATTVPRPYLSWLTRSPTSRDNAGVSFQALAVDGAGRDGPVRPRRDAQVGALGAERIGSSRRHSMRSGGISSRKRLGGLAVG